MSRFASFEKINTISKRKKKIEIHGIRDEIGDNTDIKWTVRDSYEQPPGKHSITEEVKERSTHSLEKLNPEETHK